MENENGLGGHEGGMGFDSKERRERRRRRRKRRRRTESGYNGLARLGREDDAAKDRITSFLGAFTLKQEDTVIGHLPEVKTT